MPADKKRLQRLNIIFFVLVSAGSCVGTKSAFPLPPGLDSAEASQFIQNFFQSSPSLPGNAFPFLNGFPLPIDRPNLDSFPLTSIQKQLLIEQHQKRFAAEANTLPSKLPHGTGYSSKNLSNIGGQQPEVNTNEMVIHVKSLLAENNIAQKVIQVITIKSNSGFN